MKNKATLIGTVQDVSGATIRVILAPDTVSGLSFIDGIGYKIGQIGSFVCIPLGYVKVFGVITQIGASAVPDSLKLEEPFGNRWLSIELIGEGNNKGEFERGITQYPTIDDEVHLVTQSDLAQIYGRPNSLRFVPVGNVAGSDSIPALVNVDKLVTRHSAVVGTTGSGKTTTVANLLLSLSDPDSFPSARILILDIHGEYYSALKDRATVFRVNANTEKGKKQLHIPYWALNYEELVQVTPFAGLNESDDAALMEIICNLKLETLQNNSRDGVTEDTLTIDSPVPFSIHKLWLDLYNLVLSTHTAQQQAQNEETRAYVLGEDGEPVQKGDAIEVIPPRYQPITRSGPNRVYLNSSPLNIRRQVEALGSLLRDSRYNFLFEPGDWCPDENGKTKKDLDTLLESWVGGDKPITILDLSGIPVSILNNLIGVLLRIIFDSLFWARNLSEGGRERPLLTVLEEAHVYLNSANKSTASLAAQRLVKEGRKYGLGAMVVSQRPSEIDPTILSQCGTFFALRLANSTDRSHVSGVVSDNLKGLLDMLPSLRIGEAIIVGEAVNLPMRTLIDLPPAKPDSDDPLIFENIYPGGWNRTREPNKYDEVLSAWRSQNTKSTNQLTLGEEMQRTPVASSNIASIGHCADSNTLEIEFKNGSVYQYFDVPKIVFDEMMAADSKGTFLNAQIKGSYRYARI